jgi:hypothetical protein
MLGAAVGWTAIVAISFALVVGLLVGIPNFPLLAVDGQFWRIVIWSCVAIAAVLGALGVANGVTLATVRRAISTAVERRLCERGINRLEEFHARAVVEQ